MALDPENHFTGQIAAPDLDYPYGKARDVSTPGDGTGTPFKATLVNDLFGWQQALLQHAGITPSGSPDTARESQYFLAMRALNPIRPIEFYGAIGDGVADDTAAFQAAANAGVPIALEPGSDYLISSQITGADGTRFVSAGISKITAKTGPGGFESTNIVAGDNAAAATMFLFQSVDNFGMEGVEFGMDGTAEVVLYPIYVKGGGAVKGCDFRRILFRGLSVTAGGYLNITGIENGGYRVSDIAAVDCGTALGSGYWTGTPNISVFNTDDDRFPTAGVYCAPSTYHGIVARNVLFTGDALDDYGQRTTVVSHSGANAVNTDAPDRRGPIGYGIYGEDVGYLLDLSCPHTVVKGISGARVHMYGVRLYQGAEYCHVELDALDQWGEAAVVLEGTETSFNHTQYNTVRVGTLRKGPLLGRPETQIVIVPAVLFLAGVGPRRAKNNNVHIGTLNADGPALNYAIFDVQADYTGRNYVTIDRGEGWSQRFINATSSNVQARLTSQSYISASAQVSQTITAATSTVINLAAASRDEFNEFDLGTKSIKCKFPGPRWVKGVLRVAGLDADDNVNFSILQGATVIAAQDFVATGAAEQGFEVSGATYVSESDAGDSGAEITMQVNITSAAGPLTSVVDFGSTRLEVIPT